LPWKNHYKTYTKSIIPNIMKHFYILVLSFFVYIHIQAATDALTSSNLPIVIITTDTNPSTGLPYDIPDDPKVPGTMKIIYHTDGSRNYVTDQNNTSYLSYSGKIGIELRGSSSQDLPKKAYGLTTLQSDGKTNNNVSILGMPKENDWILNALAFDGSLIRDYLSYDLYRSMGNYSPRTKYCEVIVNGDYKGLYIFMEKIKVDDNRVNITKMATTDNTYPAVTGGYITKSDKTTGGDPVAWTMYADNGWTVDFIHDYPKPADITSQQNSYIYGQFMNLSSKAAAHNESVTTGYPDIIDIPSFIDFIIMSELASNVDSYQYSTFFHKDRMGKLRAGPIWDYNLTYGLDVFGNRSLTNVWQFDNNDNEGAKFWKDLFNSPNFKCYLSKRWAEVTASGAPLNYTVISGKIDNIVSLISEAAAREQSRWYTVGILSTQISNLKTWLNTRTNWLNNQLKNYSACTNVEVPPLVISKINYHPVSINPNDEDSLEFVEITNNGNKVVNLAGIYFRELGLTYKFPGDATLQPNQKIYLASDSTMFYSYYGMKPFGRYYRSLSNKSERLLLVDAFGNTIDDVEYFDSTPWPTEADGYGSYLQLIDVNLDNSLASSWRASNIPLGTNDIHADNPIVVYPVPSRTVVHVIAEQQAVVKYQITDLAGRIVQSGQPESDNTINIEKLASNIYVLKLQMSDGENVVRKIVKN